MPFPAVQGHRALRTGLWTLALLAVMALMGLLAQPARVGGTPPSGEVGEDRLRGRLQDLVSAPGGPPGAIAVLRQGNRTVVHRAGVADRGTGRPPGPADHMRLASVAKAFNGAVALRLVDRGTLRLDDTIAERLPALPAAWGQVTLRQLLQHTSGLPDYIDSARFRQLFTEDPRRQFDSRRLLDFAANEPLRFPPGSRYGYSDSDNIAVALMAEAATHRSYENLLETLVYEPLGLRHTSLPQGYGLPGPYLHGYVLDPPAPPEDVSAAISMSGAWASGGMVSTPNDLTTFIRAYAGGQLISPTVREQQLRFVDGSSGPPGPGRNEAGLAIYRYTTRCGVVYGHTGNIPGYTQIAMATPDGRRSVTLAITEQVNEEVEPEIFERLRALEEDYACALLTR